MCNKDIKEKFSVEIKNRFEVLQSDNNTDNDPNTMHNNIIEANHPGTLSPLKSNTMLFHKL